MNKEKILCKIVYYFSQKSLDEIQLKVQKVEEDFIVKVLKNKVLILTFFITNEGRFALDKKSSTNDLSLFKSITAYCNTTIKRPMLDCFSFKYGSKQIIFSKDFSFKQKTNLLDYLKNKGHTYNSLKEIIAIYKDGKKTGMSLCFSQRKNKIIITIPLKVICLKFVKDIIDYFSTERNISIVEEINNTLSTTNTKKSSQLEKFNKKLEKKEALEKKLSNQKQEDKKVEQKVEIQQLTQKTIIEESKSVQSETNKIVQENQKNTVVFNFTKEQKDILSQYLPNSYKYFIKNELTLNIVYQCIENLNDTKTYYDYSMLVYPALRLIEGHIKTIMYNYFDLKKTKLLSLQIYFGDKKLLSKYSKQLDDVLVDYINKIYVYYTNTRHKLFHIHRLDNEETIKVLPNLISVKRIILDVLLLIDEYYLF